MPWPGGYLQRAGRTSGNDSLNLRSEMILDAKWIMHDGFLRLNADKGLDAKGRVELFGLSAGEISALAGLAMSWKKPLQVLIT